MNLRRLVRLRESLSICKKLSSRRQSVVRTRHQSFGRRHNYDGPADSWRPNLDLFLRRYAYKRPRRSHSALAVSRISRAFHLCGSRNNPSRALENFDKKYCFLSYRDIDFHLSVSFRLTQSTGRSAGKEHSRAVSRINVCGADAVVNK